MGETLTVDGTKIDQVLGLIAKLIIRLNKSSKKSKKDQNLIKDYRNTRFNSRCINGCEIEKEYR